MSLTSNNSDEKLMAAGLKKKIESFQFILLLFINNKGTCVKEFPTST